jgi:hypothetical protein
VRTRHLSLVTSTHSDITNNRESVLSPYGPVRAGLTTWQTTHDLVLTELLSSLESEVASLVSKSSTLCDTLNTVTQEVSAVLSSIATDEAGTDE